MSKSVLEVIKDTKVLINEININLNLGSRAQKGTEKSLDELTVACILDEFSYDSFKNEANFIYLTPKNWEEKIENNNIDLLLVESVWRGLEDCWKFRFVGLDKDTNFKKQSLELINDVINCFKEKNIPTVFWNKEDPIHYDEFITVAKLFDYIFTTDSNIINKYKEECNNENVYALQFAANLNIHNPIDKDKNKIGKFAFAGSWYERHEERKKVTIEILDKFSDKDLSIYDRYYGVDTNGKNIFPVKYNEYIKGSLPYEKMIEAYKQYEVFLNVNTVLDSPTMYSRRVFELLACGTSVVSTESLGIENDFKGLIPIVGKKEHEKLIDNIINDKQYRDKNAIKGVREIIARQTYTHRFNSILDKVKINYNRTNIGRTSIITCTNRGSYFENIIDNYNRQSYENKELIIIINSNAISLMDVKRKIKNIENTYVYKIDEEKTLGECINFAVSKSSGKYIAKFDDDDFYGDNYLTDMINVFKYSDADVVGKKSIYVYFEEGNRVEIKYPNTENRYIDFIAGSTIVFKKRIFEKVQMEARNTGEDTSFLNNCKSLGYKIYSSDRFNHILFRRKDKSSHTWTISDEQLQRTSKKVDIKFTSLKEVKYYVNA